MKIKHLTTMKQIFILGFLIIPLTISAQSEGHDIPLEPMEFVPGGNYAIESGSAEDSSKRVQLVLKMDEEGNLTVTHAIRDIDLVSPFHVYMYHNTQGQEEVPEEWKQWVILFDSYQVFEAEDAESICDEEAAGMEEGGSTELRIDQQQNYLLLECHTSGKGKASFPPTIKMGDKTFLEAALFVNAKSVTLR